MKWVRLFWTYYTEACSWIYQTSKVELSSVDYFRQKLYLRYMAETWMRLYYTKSKENTKSIEQTLKKGYKTKIKHFDVGI